MTRRILAAERLFDGTDLHQDMAMVVENGRIADVLPRPATLRPLPGILSPGFVDLQVNGGGGLMVGAGTTAADLACICAVHRGLGCAGVLPTLITDRPAVTAGVLEAGIHAARAETAGFLGLHLEGPHLDPRRAGAHDPALIRPMEEADLLQLVRAAADLPALMVTLAPEAVSPPQIARLAEAGVIVSLGHSDCTVAQAQVAFAAGATAATHLFNAMSQMGHRQPGLVGAILEGNVSAGLIADGFHVDPAAMRVALRARPTGLFLVSDCMAPAGSGIGEFTLHGRKILRQEGRLTLPDGTLAGADLRLDRALAVIVASGASPARALAMATSIPADVIGAPLGRLVIGYRADLVWLNDDLSLRRTEEAIG